MTLRRALVPSALVLTLALVPAAQAKLPANTAMTIVPGQSVGAVKLGMATAVAKAKWGPGFACGAAAAGPGSTQCTWSATPNARPDRGAKLTIVMIGGKVRAITVAGGTGVAAIRTIRTAKGIGVTSTRAAFAAAYPGARTPYGPDNPTLGAGKTSTTFSMVGGRVDAIQVGSPY